AVGTPLAVLMTSRDMEWPEGEDPRDTGGFLLDMASHDYDTACWLLGQEPVEVYAARQAEVYPELSDMGDLDNALVTLRFGGGGRSRLGPIGSGRDPDSPDEPRRRRRGRGARGGGRRRCDPRLRQP